MAELESDVLITTLIAILGLLLIASFAAIALKKLRFPYTVGLLLTGFGLGGLSHHLPALEPLAEIHLSHELILFLFLPPLVFESALAMDFRLLARNLTPVLLLAGPGLLISAALIGIPISWVSPLNLGQGLLFGSMVSATDPVAVIALFKELGVPHRLMILVEGESLLNDASAIVIFNIILMAIASGTANWMTAGQGLVQAVIVLTGGILTGILVSSLMGYFVAMAAANALVLSTVSAVVAYLTFIVAEHFLHVSGVIAVMAAGAVVGWLSSSRLHLETRLFISEFWEYLAFLANSLIFLLMGITTAEFVTFQMLEGSTLWISIIAAIILALVGRAIGVFTLIPLFNQLQPAQAIPKAYQVISFWGGLRGAVALALALSLAPDFPNRDLILLMILATALFTVIGGGTTMAWVLSQLGLDCITSFEQLTQAIAVVETKRAGLEELRQLESMSSFSFLALQETQAIYQESLTTAETQLVDIWCQLEMQPEILQQAVWREALNIEHKAYQQLYDEGILSELTLDKLNHLVNLKSNAIVAHEIPPPEHTTLPQETGFEKILNAITYCVIFPYHFLARLTGSTQHTIDPSFKLKYEYDVALTYVSQHVMEEVQRFADDVAHRAQTMPDDYQGINASVIEECIEAYRQVYHNAEEQLQIWADMGPEAAKTLQCDLVERAVLSTQIMVLERLVKEGALQDPVARRVRQQLELSR